MKYLGLIAGALVLVVAACVARGPIPSASERRAGARVPVKTLPDQAAPILEKAREIRGKAHEAPRVAEPAEQAPRAVLAPAQGSLLSQFERDLALSPEQRQYIETVLLDRAVEIEEFNKGVRASGLFCGEEYSRRIREIQRASYERMASAFDQAQYRRFVAMLSEGQVNDTVVFSLDPGMTVVDR